MHIHVILAGLAVALVSSDVRAARPFVTDDARIVDEGQCQIESFAKKQMRRGESEVWFLPGCNPIGGVEITAGGFRIGKSGEADELHGVLQAKTLLRRLETNNWGAAVSLGVEAIRHSPYRGDPGSRVNRPYINTLYSRSFADDRVVLHANLGAAHDRVESRAIANWGLGAEVRLSERVSGIVEAFQYTREGVSSQIGVRYWIVQDRLQIDGTLGSRAAHAGAPADQWVSVGVRWIF